MRKTRRFVVRLPVRRACVCAPRDRIVEPDGSTCWRCCGEVRRTVPFRSEDWTRR